MSKQESKIAGMFARYIFVLFLGLGNLYVFYKLFTPLTIKSIAFILSIFQYVEVSSEFIHLSYYSIQIVPACVAGAAYYLLFILVFSTPDINPKRRGIILLSSVIMLFVLNVARILILISLVGKPYFSVVHWIFWNLMSTIFVVGIWVLMVYIYNIKRIPIYSDLRYMINLVRGSKRKH